PENTLALDISVVPAAEPPPVPKAQPQPRVAPRPSSDSAAAAPWYQNRKHLYLAAGAGALLILMVISIPIARPRPAAPQMPRAGESIAKSAPKVEVAPVPSQAADKPTSAAAERAAAAAQSVKFRVSTEPSGATVSMGGQLLGTTPLSFDLPGNES